MNQSLSISDKFRIYTAHSYKVQNENGEEITVHCGDTVCIVLVDGRSYTGKVHYSYEPFTLVLGIKSVFGLVHINWNLIRYIFISKHPYKVDNKYMHESDLVNREESDRESEIIVSKIRQGYSLEYAKEYLRYFLIGEAKMAKLATYLFRDGRSEELLLATKNIEIRQKLYEEYKIDDKTI